MGNAVMTKLATVPASTTAGTANAPAPADAPIEEATGFDLLLALAASALAPSSTPTPAAGPSPATPQGCMQTDDAQDGEPVNGLCLPFLPTQNILPTAVPASSGGTAGTAAGVDAASALPGALGLEVDHDTDSPSPADAGAVPTTAVDTASAAVRQDGGTDTVHIVRTVHVPVGDRHWPEAVGHEVRVLIERGIHAATLRLSPEHLGPVEVRIDVNNDQANVWFGAAQADTRAALENALPKLRDMLASAGLTLADAGVHREAPGESRSRSNAYGGSAPAAPGVEEGATGAVTVLRAPGLIDEYV